MGLAGAVWSRKTLAGNWSSDVTFKAGHELIERGPYRWARHPIYTSLLLMLLGTAMVGGRVASFVGVGICFLALWIKLKQEERLLTRHFPAAYAAYQARVKALVPFLF